MKTLYKDNKDRSAKVVLDLADVENDQGCGGFELQVRGYEGNPEEETKDTAQVFIEKYDGRVMIHVWDGASDPVTFVLVEEKNHSEV